ncbi:DGQHR domain protein [Sulfitobacter noctilucicola]|nr:DGQHR domain protein [Sulfitobacter noctilucicola]
MENVRIAVSRVSQPIGEFYVGRIESRALRAISYVEIREFLEGKQRKIAGIQRERNEGRINEIKRYVNLEYATFPTSVIISVPPECVEFEPLINDSSGEPSLFNMTLQTFGEEGEEDYTPLDRVAFIIDGQHRVAGLEGLQDGKLFDVNVSVFIGASEADKAEIFARVNQAQTKVNPSLVVDLASFYEERGPMKFAHETILAMNHDEDGPFHDKIKRLGKAEAGKGHIQTLAQATVVKPVLDYITPDPEGDRNKRYKGIFSSKRPVNAWTRHIFQPFYDDDNDAAVFLCLTNYFNAVKARWPKLWDDAPAGTVLNRTTGYGALMKFLRPVYLSKCDKGEILTREACDEVFRGISIPDRELTREHFLPGSSGVSTLYNRLLSESGLSDKQPKQPTLL